MSIKTQYILLRSSTYYLHLRVPSALEGRYGKKFIRKSLRTAEPSLAVKRADILAKQYLAEFKAMAEGSKLSPAEVTRAGIALAAQYDHEQFVEFVVNPAREVYAKGDEDLYDSAHPAAYLELHQITALQELSPLKSESFKLSDAFTLYLDTHQRGAEEAFITKSKRDWDALISTVGDIEFRDLSRTQANQFKARLLSEGKLTTTVRRSLNTLRAVTSSAIREREIVRKNPFEGLRIQNEGKDAKPVVVPNGDQLREIVRAMRSKVNKPVALLILLQMELGTRVGEVAGLSVDDVFLDHEIPHVHIRDQPWRSLKNDVSDRRVPVVGVALDAMREAMKLPRAGKGLFEPYARSRGNDAASAAANKALLPWGITSHSFRHAMQDRLREAGCPKDIRDAIEGHGSGDVAETYGIGHSLKTMRGWLEKVNVRLE